jgi:hypothetical protein
MKRLASTLLVLLPMLATGSAFAAGGIEVTRGPDTTVYGTCVPSLLVDNKSAETVDYLEVDLVFDLADGQRRSVELKSAYREGVLYPIAPGVGATLRQHLDTSRSLGVQCSDIKARTVERTICEANGKPCSSTVSVRP